MARAGQLSADGSHYWDADAWEPLWLRPDEVITAAQECYGLSAVSAELLSDGLLNQSWRVADVVVRVGRTERSRAQVLYEHEFIRRLHKQFDIVVPALSGADGDTVQSFGGWTVSAFPFVHGTPGPTVSNAIRWPAAADVLARLHRASLDGLGMGQRPGLRSADERPRWMWPTIRPILARAGIGSPELFAVFDREVAELDEWLDDLHASGRSLVRATIHGDFNPRNLLFTDDRISAVIDWDECRVDLLAWEVAQVGFGPDAPQFWERYLAAGGPLPADDFQLLGGFARMGQLSELQWAVDDGTPGRRADRLLREIADGLTWLRHREAEFGAAYRR